MDPSDKIWALVTDTLGFGSVNVIEPMAPIGAILPNELIDCVTLEELSATTSERPGANADGTNLSAVGAATET